MVNKYAIVAIIALYVAFKFGSIEFENHRLQEQVNEYKDKLKTAEIKAKERTDALTAEVERITEESNNEIQKSKSEIDNLRNKFNRNIGRLCADRANRANMSGDPRTKNSKDGTEFGQDLGNVVGEIAVTGDEAIIKLNACIDAYNSVRAQVNRK